MKTITSHAAQIFLSLNFLKLIIMFMRYLQLIHYISKSLKYFLIV